VTVALKLPLGELGRPKTDGATTRAHADDWIGGSAQKRQTSDKW
jgi:hypothetical protein